VNASAERISAALHQVHPYNGFPYLDYPEELQGWESSSPMFVELIEELRPGLIIEVGTWKGASAAFMCEVMERNQIAGAVVCVDTWLGGMLLWDHADDPAYGAIGRFMRYGRPVELYHQFLANVMHRGYQDRIVPFPNTSANAARWLLRQGVTADLVFIDGSHDERDVYYDLVDYWAILRPGGVVSGDDWQPNYPGVERAVRRFARENGCAVELRTETKWLIRKPGTEGRGEVAARAEIG
jgi:predicted O-methyltransferase YrrM